MTLQEMRADVYDDLNQGPTPGADMEARVTRLINRAYRAILREPGLSIVRGTLNPFTFTTEDGRSIYGLPSSVLRIRSITERDSDRRLVEVSLDEIRARDPGMTESGTPWAYTVLGHRVIQEPPVSTGLWVVSASASDTTQAIQVAGIRAGGLLAPEVSANLNGTTRVAIGSLTDYVDVTSISLQQACVGVVSIYDAASGGNVIAEIGVGQISPRYLCVQLYPPPTAAVVFYADGDEPVPVLNGQNDVPILPEEFHDVITAGAKMFNAENSADAMRYQMWKRHYDLGLSRLKSFLSQPDTVAILGRPSSSAYSRAGAWYPAERWDV